MENADNNRGSDQPATPVAPKSIGARLGKKILLALLLIVSITLMFFLEERVRGSISLGRYIRQLKAQGEKMTPRDFILPRAEGENGATEVLAAAQALSAGAVLPQSYPPRMRLTPAGNAVAGFREEEWIEGKVTNHWEQLVTDLASNRVTLERIQSALAKPVLDCEFDPTLGARARFPHLMTPKKLTQWFGPRVALGLHGGKARQTLKDLVTEIELPRMLAHDGIVISELVRIAIAGVARVDTWEALQADGWTDDDLAQMRGAWERQHFAVPMTRALEGERIFAQSYYDQMRKSNQEAVTILFGMDEFVLEERPNWEKTFSDLPGGRAVADFLKKEVYCRLWRFTWLDQDQLRYLRYLESLIALSRDAGREKSLKKIQPLVTDMMLKFQNRDFYDHLRYPSEMSVSSLSRILAKSMRAETERSLVMAAIALKRYKVRHGTLPQSLSELIPEFIGGEPVDYMDGHPLRYRAQPAAGFLLYSVGEDGIDEGGDASLPRGKTSSGIIWNRKDVVWPSPATEAEVEAYRAEAAKK
jgi:hypothetical protein